MRGVRDWGSDGERRRFTIKGVRDWGSDGERRRFTIKRVRDWSSDGERGAQGTCVPMLGINALMVSLSNHEGSRLFSLTPRPLHVPGDGRTTGSVVMFGPP